MMSVQLFWTLYDLLIKSGFYEDLNWAEFVDPCATSLNFSREHCFVVCNSGMNGRVGTKIAERCWADLRERGSVSSSTFKHTLKVRAINEVFNGRDVYFEAFGNAVDKIEFLETLPHIGPIVKFHLAKNLGVDCAKPDRHLQRVAAHYGTDTATLCKRLADTLRCKQNTVDYVIWRASHLGIIKTAELQAAGEMRIYWEGTVQTEAEIDALAIYSEWLDDGEKAGWRGGELTSKGLDRVSIDSDN